MKTWKLAEAQQCLTEVIRRAQSCGPQRVTGPDGDAYVMSAADYQRVVAGFTFPDEEDVSGREPVGLLQFMQQSPLAEALREGDWPWNWDDETRSWKLPDDAVPS